MTSPLSRSLNDRSFDYTYTRSHPRIMPYRYGGQPEENRAHEQDLLIDTHLRPYAGRHRSIEIQAMVDTGAGPLFISHSLAREQGYTPYTYESADLYGVQQHKLDIAGQVQIEWSW